MRCLAVELEMVVTLGIISCCTYLLFLSEMCRAHAMHRAKCSICLSIFVVAGGLTVIPLVVVSVTVWSGDEV